MSGLTQRKLAAAAARLLDQGGQEAVTMRALAEAVGVSHNAPYRHFRDRSSLLAGVAFHDFELLSKAFRSAAADATEGAAALRRAIGAFIAYGRKHPARYRLLFSDPSLPAEDELKAAAIAPFEIFVRIVVRCQQEGTLPPCDPVRLAGMIFATAHGAIDLEIGGRASGAKGLSSVTDTTELLLRLLKP
jgi:AcrR family transcriptional regulator